MVFFCSFDGFSDTRTVEPHSLKGFSDTIATITASILLPGLVIDSDSELGSDPISEVRFGQGCDLSTESSNHQLEN